MRFQVPALGVLLLAAVRCSNEPMASEEPEVEEGTDALTSGTIDCALRSDTGYEDGNPFSIQVVTVDGKAVERRTANAFDHLRRSARLDGIDVIVVSGFRTMTEQERLWRCFQECSCNNCNPANPPGTSNHQSGSALDLNTADDGVYDWLASNAPNFRFHRTVSREPWHWEYEGGFSDDRPCGTEEASGAEVHFLEPVSGALVHGVAGVRVTAPARTHHVVYSEGGRVIGASEDASNYFLARATFSGAGARELTAVAYDVNHGELGRVRIALRSDAAGRAAIELVGPAELGWYRNGIPVSVEADPGVSSVRWIAGGFGLSTSADRAGRFAARLVFQNLGWRVITAEALDRAGATLGAASVLVRVVPGDDVRGPVSVRILTPAPGARTWTNGDLLKVAGSDSIVRVRYGADGYVMGESIERSRGFPLAYRFSQLGERLIEVRGYDASGAVRGTDRVRVEVRPEVGR